MFRQARNIKSRVPPVVTGKGPTVSASGTKNHKNKPMCRTSQYKPVGSDTVGLSASNQPSKVVWELDYSLAEDSYQKLSKRFPGIAFVQTGIGCHDHPISHTSYRVVWENVLSKLLPGQLVADVGGNPTRNKAFNRSQETRNSPVQIDTFCKVLTPKDSIRRKTRWGPMVEDGVTRWEEMTLYDMYRNERNRERFSAYDVFLMNHVIYYYTFAEVNRLLNLSAESTLYATLHKLEGLRGEINCGEQRYEKDPASGKVHQVNVDTGEFYDHPDPAPWFKNFAYADENGAFAWTVNKGCDDTYVITATATEPRLVPESCWLDGRIICHDQNGQREVIEVPRVPDSVDPPPAYEVKEVVLKTSGLLPGLEYEKELKVTITHPELYEVLCHHMINKPRNVHTLKDLTAKAQREVGNNLYAGKQKKVDISPPQLAKQIAAAWYSGAELEHDLFTFATNSTSAVRNVNNNLSGKSLAITQNNIVKQGLRFALLAQSVGRSKDPVRQAMEYLDELL